MEREKFQMDRTTGFELHASTSLSVNVFTAPGKAWCRPRASAKRAGFNPIPSFSSDFKKENNNDN